MGHPKNKKQRIIASRPLQVGVEKDRKGKYGYMYMYMMSFKFHGCIILIYLTRILKILSKLIVKITTFNRKYYALIILVLHVTKYNDILLWLSDLRLIF